MTDADRHRDPGGLNSRCSWEASRDLGYGSHLLQVNRDRKS